MSNQISDELLQQVKIKVSMTVSKIEYLYNTKFSKPIQIRYDINSSRLAGQAIYRQNVIRINPMFLNKYTDKFINQTIVHEVAHLGVYQVYNLDKGHSNIKHHGSEWKNMMIRLGADPSRCHSYEADEGVGRQKTKYAYICECCNKPIPVGPKIHSNIQNGKRYKTTCCKSKLIFKGVVGAVSKNIAIERIAANTLDNTVEIKSTEQLKAPNPTSKLGRCYALYKQHYLKQLNRGQWITMFVTQCECTSAGASTYLSTCVKLFNQGI